MSFWNIMNFLAKRELSWEIESIAVDYDSSNYHEHGHDRDQRLDGRNTQVFKCDW